MVKIPTLRDKRIVVTFFYPFMSKEQAISDHLRDNFLHNIKHLCLTSVYEVTSIVLEITCSIVLMKCSWLKTPVIKCEMNDIN